IVRDIKNNKNFIVQPYENPNVAVSREFIKCSNSTITVLDENIHGMIFDDCEKIKIDCEKDYRVLTVEDCNDCEFTGGDRCLIGQFENGKNLKIRINGKHNSVFFTKNATNVTLIVEGTDIVYNLNENEPYRENENHSKKLVHHMVVFNSLKQTFQTFIFRVEVQSETR
ncbi:hypothetical protein MHBO_003152, partial [Bonamia ostreae]